MEIGSVRLRMAVIVVVGFVVTSNVAAQQPDATGAFVSALPRLSDAQLDSTDTSVNDVVQHGFLALERFNRTHSEKLLVEAARAFCTAIKNQPARPWAHFGLGMTLLTSGKVMPIVRQAGIDNGEALQSARRELQKAVDADTLLRPAVQVLLSASQHYGAAYHRGQHDAPRTSEIFALLRMPDPEQAAADTLDEPATSSNTPRDAALEQQAFVIGDELQVMTNADSVHARYTRCQPRRSSSEVLCVALAALRMAALVDDSRYSEAKAAFDSLAQRASQPAWRAYGNALIERQRYDDPGFFALWNVLRRTVGQSRQNAAENQAVRALVIDRTFAPALALYAQLALDQYTTEPIWRALGFIDNAGPLRVPVVDALAVLLELARDSVPAAAARVAALDSVERAAPIVEYARAQVLFRQGNFDEGFAQFRAAVLSGDARVRAQARWDTAPLYPGGAVIPEGSALLAYWDARAALYGTSMAERVAEHYRRLNEARQHYRKRAHYAASGSDRVVLRELAGGGELDPRGIVYVRRGKPQNLALKIDDASFSREAWVYGQNDVYTFTLSGDQSDWSLTTDLICDGIAADSHRVDPVDKSVHNRATSPTDWLMQMVRYDAKAFEAYTACRAGDSVRLFQLNKQAGFDLQARMQKESVYRPEKDLPFYFSLQLVRAVKSTDPVSVVVFAVPVSKLKPDTVQGRVRYRFRANVGLVDSLTHKSMQKDTTITYDAGKGLAANTLVRVIMEVPGMASRVVDYRVRVVDLNDAKAGHVYDAARAFDAFPKGQLAISDILFSRPDSSSTGWKRDNLLLDLIPVQQFGGGRFGMFFELYNVVGGGVYKIDIAIGEKSGNIFRPHRRLGLSFNEQMPGGTGDRVPVFKSVKLDLGPGKYLVRVTVSDPSGARVTRERELVITE